MSGVPLSQHDRRGLARLAQDRWLFRQWQMAVLVMVVVVLGAGIIVLARRYSHGVAVDLLRERSEVILQAMRDRRPPPPYNHSADIVYSPPSWTITAADVMGTRGHVRATIDNPSAEGVPDTLVWELRFSEINGTGWTCTSIVAVGPWFDDEGWR